MTEEFAHKLKYYEQNYFTNDEPVPFVGNLKLYPATVRDYYKFYSLISIFTLNKNEDPKGISMSNLEYIFSKMSQEGDEGEFFARQFIALLEMVFHIKNGRKCLKCGDFIDFDEVHKKILEFHAEEAILLKSEPTEEQIQDLKNRYEVFLEGLHKCNKCNCEKVDVIRYEEDSNKKKILYIDNIPINRKQFDELRQIVCYQNILDHDDEYIDPELKAELEEAARLRNPNAVQPSLEKQEACILTNSAYTFETIKDMTIRKMVLLLRTIDAKLHYMAYRQGELSGMVKFNKEIDHWIYSNNKPNKFDSIVSLDSLKNKINKANG